MSCILDPIFGPRLKRETDRYLRELAHAPTLTSRARAKRLLARLASEPGPKLTLGETQWSEPVVVPLDEILKAYGLVTGGTGSGKSMLALGILERLIDEALQMPSVGFGVLDAKGDLFQGTLYLLGKRLAELARENPEAADALRRRIVIYDFSSRDPVSSYNILARWPNAEPDFFAWNRAELLLDLLPGPDGLSLGATAVLQKLLLLFSESSLPITVLGEFLDDGQLRKKLLARCRDRTLASYFSRQFVEVPKPTIAAIRRRIEALFASEGVRLALAGITAPDFRSFQDESRIVLINCFGETISRGVRRLLQGLVLSDIRQAVFTRKERHRTYLWLCDEAQNFFLTEKLRDNMTDLLTMSRSFGSFFVYLTQNMATAVHDARVLRILTTNIRWSFSMRGEPGDCAFLKPVLPVSGRKVRPDTNPFTERSFYSIAEERAIALDDAAHLPDRVGWLWLRTRSAEALKVTTRELRLPSGKKLEEATHAIRSDPAVGARLSRAEYERLVAEREHEWMAEEPGDMEARLRQAYGRARGESET